MRTFTFILAFACFLVFDLRAQTVQWVKPQEKFAPYISGPYNIHNYIKSDGRDLISTAIISDTITFGNQTFTGYNFQNGVKSMANKSYLAKHNTEGILLWARHLEGAIPLELATDANKNIFISGYYDGPLQIGTLILTGSGKRQNFIAKFSPQGSLLWAINLPHISGASVHDYLPITTDGYGNVYVTCQYNKIINIGSYTFNPTPNAFNPNPTGRNDILLVKFDPNGTLQWAKSMGSPAYEDYPVIAGGVSNSVYIAYESFIQDQGYFIRKFDATGTEEWFKYLPGIPNYPIPTNYHLFVRNLAYLTRDDADNVYLAAKIDSVITIGNQTIGIFNGNKEDAFVAKFSSSGAFKWAERVPGPATAEFRGMDMRPGNELNFLKIDYRFYPYYPYDFPSSQDLILAKLDTSGTQPQVFAINNIPGEYEKFNLSQTSTDDLGNFYISGFLGGTINLGAYSISAPPPSFNGFSTEPSISFIGKVQISPLAVAPSSLADLNVFPNPAQNQVTIETAFSKGKPVTVRLVNLVGQVVAETTLPANNQGGYQMPLKDLPKGVYIVQLETETGSQTKRLVIQ